ncbi:MAG: threonylcarbamoyl-AMP synthase [Candidatus Daviesbacteria bacterium]|nr:MAG: threonylcarbamoyl-AMP synthase [Candidatus Daviesbacteria bacterium]
MDEPNLKLALLQGKIVVMPTDTIYGIVGSALTQETVEKIYALRKRALSKPMIILISSLEDLKKFKVELDSFTLDFLNKHWPAALSVVLPCLSPEFEYLHRGTKSLAFRMPKNIKLLNLLRQVGPLVAPSANFEGEKPAENVEEARKYFGDEVIYVDGGKLSGQTSTLIEIKNSQVKILREGAVKV